MFKRFTSICIAIALTQTAHAFDLGAMVNAGKDLTTAATLSDSDTKKLASEASVHYDKDNSVAPVSNPYAKRLAKLTRGMKTENGLKLNIKVYLVQDINAFAMADGTVRVFSGLMDKMTDDEVRYVIGHEIGHVSLGHSKKALQTAYVTSAARKAGGATGNGLVALTDSALGDLTEKLVHAQFSQSQESDADQFALKLMKANRYDPKAAVTALRKLESMYGNDKSMFSSHPAPGDRATDLEKQI
ncbi:MAG: M48 family metallopeptidase [Desulfuromonadales bacterium]|nr:M48 family metallopeptidase [Desulfuromonadales bacterium]